MNLVQLFLDKDSGKLIAKPVVLSGGGNTEGYTHEQTTPSTIWTVVHGLNTLDVIYQVFDSTREHIIPDSFNVIDANTVQVTFGVNQIGFLQIVVL